MARRSTAVGKWLLWHNARVRARAPGWWRCADGLDPIADIMAVQRELGRRGFMFAVMGEWLPEPETERLDDGAYRHTFRAPRPRF